MLKGVGYSFEHLAKPWVRKESGLPKGLFGPGYRIVDVVNEAPKGATFLAILLKDITNVRACILKQGRPHCMSDRYGRDVRWRLKREFDILSELSSVEGLPQAHEYFELDGNGYLAMDYLESKSIEETVAGFLNRQPWSEVERCSKLQLLNHLKVLIDIVAAIHAKGFIHRDLNNSNVRVGPSGQTYLFDFEMAHRVGDSEPPVGSGTAGFVPIVRSPSDIPIFSDDVYSICCVALLILTGIDPRRTLYADANRRVEQIRALTGGGDELEELVGAVASGLHADHSRRPTLCQLSVVVREAIAASESPKYATPKALSEPALIDENLSVLLSKAVEGLLYQAPRGPSGLWLSPPLGSGDQGIDRDHLELLRSSHCGVAGILYTLAQLARHGWRADNKVREDAKKGAEWLLSDVQTPDRGLPGLHFGEAGVALALHELVAADLVQGRRALSCAIVSRLPGVLDWPDLSHGAAGQGLAALTAAPSETQACLNFVLNAQNQDGSWSIPHDAPALAGEKLTGFAHGSAGIVYFLAEYGMRIGTSAVDPSLHLGLEWLTKAAIEGSNGVLNWPYSATDSRPSMWWCHGAPGIALGYLRAYECTRERSLLDIGLRALRTHTPNIRYGNLSYCHGLSGLGEIYLEAYRVTRDSEWLHRARALTVPIAALARIEGSGATWAVEDPSLPVADLGLGLCSVIHFLLRLHVGPDEIGLPLMPAPLGRVSGAKLRVA